MGMLDGKVAIVTGAGRGVGRAEALLLAGLGAKVVVNDLGVSKDGVAEGTSPAGDVVEEVVAKGGQAVANGADVSDWEQSAALIQQAVDTYGRLDILVNNAGILRDRMLWNLTELDFDLVIEVNLKGTFNTVHHAAVYWRAQNKAGNPIRGRIINTPSSVGLFGNIGQVNYASAKAGVAGMTVAAALELKRLGITVNAICPRAESRMTAGLVERTEEELARRDPAYVAGLVAYLASDEAQDISGRVFEASGYGYEVIQGASHGAICDAARDEPGVEGLGDAVHRIVRNSATPNHYDRGEFWDL